ncbi:MAG: CPBP family intramembrane metalloprotease [Bacteroidota bacterium]|nr:CPBP family intramembrane metalloprotease [Bacteroidota bacterium]
MINTPYKQLDKRDKFNLSPGLQFLVFFGIALFTLVLCSMIGMGIVFLMYGIKTMTALGTLDVTAPHFVAALWIVQIIGTTLPIFGVSVLFAKVFTNNPDDYIKPSFRFPWLLLVIVFVLMFVSNPLIELLSNINQKMVLPHWLQWMRQSEDSAQKVMNAMLNMHGISDVIIDVLLVGLVTAIVEEFMFRGVIQTIFFRWTKNVHAAVWITAILFSAFHMEFFGFLPRLLLGVFFGYFVAWSGSIWTGVWAHFINNATDVVVTYLYQHKIIAGDPNEQHMFNYIGYTVSFILVMILMYAYKGVATAKVQIPVE